VSLQFVDVDSGTVLADLDPWRLLVHLSPLYRLANTSTWSESL
jgi:hypothetical protein